VYVVDSEKTNEESNNVENFFWKQEVISGYE
jgi:hypothetical protein